MSAMERGRSGVVVLGVVLVALVFVAPSGASNYTNPVILPNSPDPGVLFHNGVYYAATTSLDDPDHYPIHTSGDLVTWHLSGYVFPRGSKTQPKWAVQDYWAPEIHLVNGKFVVYFTARDTSGVLCIGAAHSTSNSPLGPYEDIGQPLVKNGTMGSIDATFFMVQEGNTNTPMLYWKNDGNAVGLTTYILVRPLNADGLSFKSGTQPEALIYNNLSWEGPVVEGPWVIHRKGWYYLFYSANGYVALNPDGTCKYAVGVARSKSPTGPFVKYPQPILHSYRPDRFTGPGHCSVVQWPGNQGDDYYMVYHAWTFGRVGGGYPRHMLVDKVSWDRQGWPSVYKDYPSYTPQPTP